MLVGRVSESISVDNGALKTTKVEDFTSDSEVNVYPKYQIDNFSVCCPIIPILFADDADLIAHTEEDMQLIIGIFSRACLGFGPTINLKKTKVVLSFSCLSDKTHQSYMWLSMQIDWRFD